MNKEQYKAYLRQRLLEGVLRPLANYKEVTPDLQTIGRKMGEIFGNPPNADGQYAHHRGIMDHIGALTRSPDHPYDLPQSVTKIGLHPGSRIEDKQLLHDSVLSYMLHTPSIVSQVAGGERQAAGDESLEQAASRHVIELIKPTVLPTWSGPPQVLTPGNNSKALRGKFLDFQELGRGMTDRKSRYFGSSGGQKGGLYDFGAPSDSVDYREYNVPVDKSDRRGNLPD
jgi:hypothetical protein